MARPRHYCLYLSCAHLITALLLMPHVAAGDVLRVPGGYTNIQSAVVAASAGDTVLVAPGVYMERVTIGTRLVLLSEAGPEMTTIDAQQQGTTIFVELQAAGTIIEGFRISGGFVSNGNSGGVHFAAFPGQGGGIIRGNIIEHNTSYGGAGGVYVC